MLLNTTGQVGGALGLAVLATIAAAAGYHVAWLVSAGLVVVTIGIPALALRPRTAPTLEGVAGEAAA